MAFKSFFDGGNQPDSRQYRVLTLAGLSGNSLHWTNFDAHWALALDKHGAKYLHTTDAVSLQGIFHRDKGWNRAKVDALIEDCARVLTQSCAQQNTERVITYPGLRPATVTVALDDFMRALKKVPDLGTPEHLCAIHCAEFVYQYSRLLGANQWQFYFDRGELFYGHLKVRQENKKSRRATPLLSRVVLTEENMREVPALQAADLFAWSVTHFYQDGRCTRVWQPNVLAIKREDAYLRYRQLLHPIRETVDLVNSWGLPKRRAPR